jgi:electron transfer flavoprotein alpha subunit
VQLGYEIPETESEALIARGADRVYLLDDPALAHFLVQPYAHALKHLVETDEPEVFIAAATTTGRTVMPYLSALVHAGLTADCTGLAIDPETDNLLQTRPAIGGNIMATILTPKARPQMATVRPNSAPPTEADSRRTGEVVLVDLPTEALDTAMRQEAEKRDAPGQVALSDAELVVSGGRGLGKAENFALLEALAEALGGTVAASRAAVDRGWQPYPRQVGLSGKTISPRLYLACGISGAIQHLAGMQTAEHIIAINSDPDAQIFQVADLGIVGDLFQILPAVLERLEEKEEA